MKKILIVEDERSVSALLRHVLQGHGYEVDCAFDGLEGLEKIQAASPHLVILDVNMPRMDGWQLLTSLKASPVTRSIPVVMCTEQNLIKEIERADELGADGYILKPFIMERVLSKIDALLS
jgi:two-component system chemotaxis response regulator CheY